MADGVTFQHLEGRDLIDTHDPDALFRQPSRISIAPKDLLRSLFELGIQPSGLPVAGAMGLQIDGVQDVPHGARADASHDLIRYRLTCQVKTRPMRDVQPFGDGFQTSEFNDLCSLHRRNLQVAPRVALPVISEQSPKPQASVQLTGSPDGRFVAVELEGEVFSSMACSDSEDNSSTSNLIPGRCITVSDPFQLGGVWRKDRQPFGSASTHGGSFYAENGKRISVADSRNSVQVLVPGTLGHRHKARTTVPDGVPRRGGGRRWRRGWWRITG